MFSFHKPKVYRSSTGCCICRAKSSSSRFTDSKKYEDDFMDCFQLHERRSGEICNACVLLVKRWKKLPPGSDRNWRHVVDARAGPGTKSLTKFKSKNKKKLKLKANDSTQKVEKVMKKKHVYLKREHSSRVQSPGEISDEMAVDDCMSDNGGGSPPCLSPMPSDYSTPATSVKQRTKARSPHRHEKGSKRRMSLSPTVSSFLDLTIWKKEKVCCGTIFKGPCGVVIVDPRFLKPCQGCRTAPSPKEDSAATTRSNSTDSNPSPHIATPDTAANPNGNNSSGSNGDTSKLAKSFSDSSSDSGYDESSNQGTGEAGHNNLRRSGGNMGHSTHTQEDAATANSLAEFAMHAVKRCPQEVKMQTN